MDLSFRFIRSYHTDHDEGMQKLDNSEADVTVKSYSQNNVL